MTVSAPSDSSVLVGCVEISVGADVTPIVPKINFVSWMPIFVSLALIVLPIMTVSPTSDVIRDPVCLPLVRVMMTVALNRPALRDGVFHDSFVVMMTTALSQEQSASIMSVRCLMDVVMMLNVVLSRLVLPARVYLLLQRSVSEMMTVQAV